MTFDEKIGKRNGDSILVTVTLEGKVSSGHFLKERQSGILALKNNTVTKVTKHNVEQVARGYLLYELARRGYRVQTTDSRVPTSDMPPE